MPGAMSGSEKERAAHAAFQSLPVVDVGGLYSDELETRRLGAACRDAGFFYLTGHRVGDATVAGLLAQAEAFFTLPSAQKLEYYVGKSANHRGFVPPGEEVFYGGARDQKQSFDLCFELPEGAVDTRSDPFAGANVWPALPGFRDAVGRYYAAVFELGRRLVRARSDERRRRVDRRAASHRRHARDVDQRRAGRDLAPRAQGE